jgi:hypothetical protein
MINYDLRLFTPSGTHLNWLTRYSKLDWAIAENQVGYAEIILPQKDFSFNDFEADQILDIYRSINNQKGLIAQRAWFLQDWDFYEENGKKEILIILTDSNDLLSRRIVAYDAGSAEADKTDYADDMMKEIVDENLVSATDTDRNIANLTVQAQSGSAGSISRSFARYNVLSVLQGISDTAREAGDYLVFDTVRTGRATFEFRTYLNQRGSDRSSDSANRLIVSAEAGNLINPHLKKVHSKERNFVYAAGQGQESERVVGSYENTTATSRSIWARREDFIQNNLTDSTTVLDDTAQGEAYNQRARTILTGDLVQSKSMQFGSTYDFGDIITAKYLGVSVDCHVEAVSGSVQARRGRPFEKIEAKLRGEI